jgi:hypothetical protein
MHKDRVRKGQELELQRFAAIVIRAFEITHTICRTANALVGEAKFVGRTFHHKAEEKEIRLVHDNSAVICVVCLTNRRLLTYDQRFTVSDCLGSSFTADVYCVRCAHYDARGVELQNVVGMT